MLEITYNDTLFKLENKYHSTEAYTEDLPIWFPSSYLTLSEIQGINYAGCSGQAFMPAVHYYRANKHMSNFGDNVLLYIEDTIGELPPLPQGQLWSGIAVFYLSYAVELWCSQFDADWIENQFEKLKEKINA